MDLPVLKYLDVFIGLAFVMLLGCTVVATITQLLTSGFYLRAQYLREGLMDLLQELDPSLTSEQCEHLANLIQRNPAVARVSTGPGLFTAALRNWVAKFRGKAALPSGAPAVVIQRHEFLRLLLEWAAGEGVYANDKALNEFTGWVKTALQRVGVDSPRNTYRALQFHTLLQERSNPTLASHMWHTAAAIDACPTAFVSKIHGRYDSMTTRITQRFTLQAKMIGTVVALLVAIVLPLDSIELVQRLLTDDKFRNELVERAKTVDAKEKAVQPTGSIATAAELQTQIEALNKVGIGYGQKEKVSAYIEAHFKGLLLSWILLSLGAPFWYDAIKNALKLRSVLAQKDDQDKTDRQRASPGTTTAPSTATQSAPAGVVGVTAQPVGGS